MIARLVPDIILEPKAPTLTVWWPIWNRRRLKFKLDPKRKTDFLLYVVVDFMSVASYASHPKRWGVGEAFLKFRRRSIAVFKTLSKRNTWSMQQNGGLHIKLGDPDFFDQFKFTSNETHRYKKGDRQRICSAGYKFVPNNNITIVWGVSKSI